MEFRHYLPIPTPIHIPLRIATSRVQESEARPDRRPFSTTGVMLLKLLHRSSITEQRYLSNKSCGAQRLIVALTGAK